MHPVDGIDAPLPELVTGVVQHEYFKFQVQKQVEEQVQTYLSKRVKVAGALATVLLTVLGAFGVQQYFSFTGMVADVRDKSDQLTERIRSAEELVVRAQNAVSATDPLLQLAKENVASSQVIMQNAGTTAMQTGDLARAVLGQVQSTQANVEARSGTLMKNLTAASETLDQLQTQRTYLTGLSASIASTNELVTMQRHEIEDQWQKIRTTSEALTRGLDFERQLAEAKTFEIVLLRDRRSVEITLPDFRDIGTESRRQFKLLVESTRIKDDVDFQITVNGRTPVHSFRRFVQGQVAEIPGSPFEVRVDSIYHAKLAYDFVLLRIKPKEGTIPSASPRLASTSGQSN